MKINVSHENDDKFALIDVSDDIEYENFKALCAAEFGFEGTDSFSLVWNGNLLSEIGSKALRSLGVGDNDMVLVRPRGASSNSATPQINMDSLRSMIGSNPQQLERIKQQFPELADAIERGDQGNIDFSIFYPLFSTFYVNSASHFIVEHANEWWKTTSR